MATAKACEPTVRGGSFVYQLLGSPPTDSSTSFTKNNQLTTRYFCVTPIGRPRRLASRTCTGGGRVGGSGGQSVRCASIQQTTRLHAARMPHLRYAQRARAAHACCIRTACAPNSSLRISVGTTDYHALPCCCRTSSPPQPGHKSSQCPSAAHSALCLARLVQLLALLPAPPALPPVHPLPPPLMPPVGAVRWRLPSPRTPAAAAGLPPQGEALHTAGPERPPAVAWHQPCLHLQPPGRRRRLPPLAAARRRSFWRIASPQYCI